MGLSLWVKVYIPRLSVKSLVEGVTGRVGLGSEVGDYLPFLVSPILVGSQSLVFNTTPPSPS